jgi:hypothetical protein
MTVTISISEDVAMKLEQRAAGLGQTVPAYASPIVTETVTKPTVDEVLGPFRKQVADSGMSDEELDEFLRGELEVHRREKRAKSA